MVQLGDRGCIELLIENGADVNSYRTPPEGSFADGPPLHLALNQRRWEIAMYLLSEGANPNLLTSWPGPDNPGGSGYSALDMATDSSAPPDVIQELISHGAEH